MLCFGCYFIQPRDLCAWGINYTGGIFTTVVFLKNQDAPMKMIPCLVSSGSSSSSSCCCCSKGGSSKEFAIAVGGGDYPQVRYNDLPCFRQRTAMNDDTDTTNNDVNE